MRAEVGVAIIALSLSGFAASGSPTAKTQAPSMVGGTVLFSEPHASNKTKLDIYEATIRYRLRQAPLPRGSKLYLYINWGAPPGLARRFPDFKTTVRAGSQGNSPPRDRYYFIMLNRVTDDHAFLILEEAHNGVSVDLTKQRGQWTVSTERPAMIW